MRLTEGVAFVAVCVKVVHGLNFVLIVAADGDVVAIRLRLDFDWLALWVFWMVEAGLGGSKGVLVGGDDVETVCPTTLYGGVHGFGDAVAFRVFFFCRIRNVFLALIVLSILLRIFSGARGSNFQVANIVLWISWYGVSSVVSLI